MLLVPSSTVRHCIRHGDPFRLSCGGPRVTTCASHHMISNSLPSGRSLAVATMFLLVVAGLCSDSIAYFPPDDAELTEPVSGRCVEWIAVHGVLVVPVTLGPPYTHSATFYFA